MYQDGQELTRALSSKYRDFRLAVGMLFFTILVLSPLQQVTGIGRPFFTNVCNISSIIAALIILLILLILWLRWKNARYGHWFSTEAFQEERWSLYLLLLSIMGFVVGMILAFVYWTYERPSGLEFSRIWDVLSSYYRLAALYLGVTVYSYFVDRRGRSQLRGARVMTRFIQGTGMDVEDSVAWALNSIKRQFTRKETGGFLSMWTGSKEITFDVDFGKIRVQVKKLAFGGYRVITYTHSPSEIPTVKEFERILEGAARGWRV